MHHHDMMPPTSGGFFHNLLQWFAGNGYAPHSGCFLGDNYWVGAYVAANWVIALAYALVAMLIAQRMRRASHIPRTLMGNALLGIFVTCAGGHFLAGITTVLWPGYRFETMWHWLTTIPAWIFLAHHNKFSLIVEGPHMIAESREELSLKNGELNTLYEQVKHLDQLKSEFFANVSHELRTPLALILGPVQNVLAGDNLTDTQRRDLEVVARNARTVLKHVNDLLDISRLEAGKMKMRYAEVDLAQMARVLASDFETVVRERELTLTVDAPETLNAQADSDKLQRILLNLFSNAVKFVPAGGTILCRLQYEGSEAIIEVQDSGPGIPLELRGAIFERFRQVDATATRRYEGTGLGLAIVKDFIELHGGGVMVTDAPGGGALFRLHLPIFAPAGVEVTPNAGESAAPDTASASTGHSGAGTVSVSGLALSDNLENVMMQTLEELRAREQSEAITQETGQPLVLVVEDNREMSRFIIQSLAPRYRAVAAYDGAEGLASALELRPDLILSDIMMPNKSGDQMVAEIRTHPELDAIPVVLLTAKADDDLRVRLLKEGAQDYLMKPFAPEELRARVANLVSMKRARQALQEEVTTQQQSLETLAEEVIGRKRALQTALGDAQAARYTAEQAREEAWALQHVVQERNTQLTQAIQEAHHRIKNNLQIVAALLEMQIDDCGEALPAAAVRERLRQIQAIGLVHNLLTRETNFNEVDAGRALEGLVDLMQRCQAGIPNALPIRLKAETLKIPAKVATALVLIVYELVSNAQKYGHPFPAELSRSSTAIPHPKLSQEAEPENVISIHLRHTQAEAILSIEDPGSGFPIGFDVYRDAHLGLELVATLVQSDLQGGITFGGLAAAPGDEPGRQPGGRVEIVFPEHPAAA